MALHLLPVLVSPTTIRAGYKTRNIVKSTSEFIAGDAFFIGKYDIPSVDLAKCDESLDFACLLAIGTTPINIQTKQLDGLVKTSTLLSVRPTGVATYSHLPAVISRGEISLVINTSPEAILVLEVSVKMDGLSTSETQEGNIGVSVKINSLAFTENVELDGNVVLVKVDSQFLISTTDEGNLGVSVKMNGNLVSEQVEN